MSEVLHPTLSSQSPQILAHFKGVSIPSSQTISTMITRWFTLLQWTHEGAYQQHFFLHFYLQMKRVLIRNGWYYFICIWQNYASTLSYTCWYTHTHCSLCGYSIENKHVSSQHHVLVLSIIPSLCWQESEEFFFLYLYIFQTTKYTVHQWQHCLSVFSLLYS